MTDQARFEILFDDISTSFFNINNKNKNLEHLDNTNDKMYSWDVYYIPETPYRVYLTVEGFNFGTEDSKMAITITSEPDPDFESEKDFNKMNNGSYEFDIDVSDYEEFDKTRLSVYDNLEKGYEKAMMNIKKTSKNIFVSFERDLEKYVMEPYKKHEWMTHDWIDITKIVLLSELNISEIPLTLEFLKLDNDERFLTQEVKDIFIF